MAQSVIPSTLALAREELGEGKILEAEQRLRTLAVDRSWSAAIRAIALNDLGVIAHHEGEWEQARQLLEVSLVHDDTVALTHVNLGQTLERLSQPGEAVAAYRAAGWCGGEEPSWAQHLRRAAAACADGSLATRVLNELRSEHRLVPTTEQDLGFLRNDYHPGRRRALEDFYLRAASLASGGRVLEWDSGTGVGCEWMGRHGCLVTGVGESREAVQYARRHAQHPQVAYVERERFRPPPPGDRGYDLVVMRAPDPQSNTLSRLIELVTPGGHLIVPESWLPSGPPEGTRVGEKPPEIAGHLPGRPQRSVCLVRSGAAALEA
ncbi:MAG: hypothetical protein CMJ83_06255 [Planctomycetes bacterium]|nr:hypothetical protein [Planctomycetota bacterium]